MKKLLSFVSLAATMGLLAQAATITPQQALNRLSKSGARKLQSAQTSTLSLAATQTAADGEATLYVFNRPANKGYVILAADDAAAPVLGYSDAGNYTAAAESPEFRYWLDEYSRQIEYARQNSITPAQTATTRAEERKAIGPLLTTQWAQDGPYNNETPIKEGKHCVTGCVATAMAQIMNYWEYPKKGHGRFTNSGIPLDLESVEFDWQNMHDTYHKGGYTDAQANAVAMLMKACGFSINMGYTPNESGAYSVYVGKALTENFDYNKNMTFVMRWNNTDSFWDQTVYNELAAGRPVYYSGRSLQGGHAFVCDGYNGEGLYHFNWGWGGLSDGFFRLQALDPSSLGIGGGTGGYNIGQEIIVGLQPQEAERTHPIPALIQDGIINADVVGTDARFWITDLMGNPGLFWNYTFEDQKEFFGVSIQDANDASKKPTVLPLERMDLGMVYGMWGSATPAGPLDWMKFSTTNLSEGEYLVTLATMKADGTDVNPVRPYNGASNAFKLIKDQYGARAQTIDMGQVRVTAADFTSELYYNTPVDVSVKLRNYSDTEFTQIIAPLLRDSNGQIAFRFEGAMVTLQPKETKTFQFTTSPILQNGIAAPTADTNYYMSIVNNELNSYYTFSRTVTMKVNNPELSVTNFEIPDTKTETVYVNRYGQYAKCHIVGNKEAINFKATIANKSGFYKNDIIGFVFDIESGEGSNIYTMFTPVLNLGAGESADITSTLNFSSGVPNKLYLVDLFYENGGRKNLGNFVYFKIDPNASGVNDAAAEPMAVTYCNPSATLTVTSDSDIDSVVVTNMGGMQVLGSSDLPAGSHQLSLAHLPAGIYVATVRAGGRTRTVKVNR